MAQRKDKSQAMREKILNTATQLFIQKGSEKTSMQDIAQTAGISKGAIYHHFKSKDEIVLAVIRSRQELMEEEMKQWLKATENLTGREQLQTILKSNLESQTARATDGIVGEYEKDAGFILTMMRDNLRIGAPLVSDIIKKGMADGSLRTQYPDQAAEVFLLLVNFWMHGTIFESDPEKLPERFHFLQFMMTSVGMDIFNDELLQLFSQKNKA
ncbi:TetR/AcrR family transcriptional regulator [Streptococcus gordonii]|uniref:TetR/AcrR family transcriptional regulator n=1 Tax=Streptococcus gordonii TaxID=1302 RepID=A0AB35FQM0_STRGN|nr:TetR/AcrR family transcriptional regulator [Streptococcus gordonii]MBW7663276.1 TetR/AcrR family transcriptional regulator [Streptococcus gordonii]MBZ2126689.1 TetR/AcrR family transcriptional regulator [Streptococcus gordonii]MBZ2128703.1 TetR/AcrR family transcriptional regulator [Streptococcus gordonii]MBZ2139857.1 TetR/AcrR family transcriptional regulator [Streptococcus gordonii]RSJ47316.1 HTH-type transcriptional repressor KstR2 [Streptococcus gordonii]